MSNGHTGTRDAFLAAYHRERAERRRRRRNGLLQLLGRRRRAKAKGYPETVA